MMLNATISNSRFKYTNHPGTGNKSCRGVSDAEKLRLSNVLIDDAGVDEFLSVLYGTGEPKMSVELSNRRTSRQWGTAWYWDRRTVIYRHTAWVVLHEIAHIINVSTDFTGNVTRTVKAHGPAFGRHLTCLYQLWMEFCDKGINNILPKEGKPDLKNDYFLPGDLVEKKNQWKVPERRPRLVGGISLQVGDLVWFMGRGRKIFATVIRVNQKTCRVKPIDGTRDWRVSPKLLNKEEK
jgi:hypothetical protein